MENAPTFTVFLVFFMIAVLLIIFVGVIICLCRNSHEVDPEENHNSSKHEPRTFRFGQSFPSSKIKKDSTLGSNQLVINIPDNPTHPVITLTKASIKRNEEKICNVFEMSSKVSLPSLTTMATEKYMIKRPPSIIAHRKSKVASNQSEVNPLLRDEIDQVLATNFQVKNGVFVQANQSSQPLSISSNSQKKLVLYNSENGNNVWRTKSLPGTAEDVESYPCRICNNVFLTGKGLETHAAENHPSQVEMIKDDIVAISSEWRRRELQFGRLPKFANGRSRRNLVFRHKSPGVYEICPICDVAIKIDTKDALEVHKQKHANGEVDLELNCGRCGLRFPTHDAYTKHMSSHRKRSYICKVCEAKFQFFCDLRKHKLEVHDDHSLLKDASGSNQAKNADYSIVKAKCSKCNSVFQKAELLIKHSFTAHQDSSFSATIQVKGLPVYSILVNSGKLNFKCCDIVFDSRTSFISHRSTHEPKCQI
uniref:C2H2-type domain-containing protein n=1 Tax=Panagrolaimus sp. JU765 TaxID=591449 RepID=A0AC34QN26_9BILA